MSRSASGPWRRFSPSAPTIKEKHPMHTNHRSHLLGMLGIAALVVLALLAAGRSLGEALPLAALLACPLMMIGMMFMGHGAHGHAHRGGDAPPPAEHPSADRSPGDGSESARR
ncbi:hypothetical protein CGZ91_03530 [Parenemella sanctibonifatiensis]|uniref:DUF2933 domain-containing protein n=2 Tax=Propionibacteriales TaxID=85009 RepID=A0A255ET11_9ACTN|nr:hypothetical protein CGZ91_03530 [Parenemella sanctibonifatiensis]